MGSYAAYPSYQASMLPIIILGSGTTLATAAQSGAVFVFRASSMSTLQLPLATGSGTFYYCVIKGTFAGALQASGLDIITLGSASTAGGTQTSSTSACHAIVCDTGAATWRALAYDGTWTPA